MIFLVQLVILASVVLREKEPEKERRDVAYTVFLPLVCRIPVKPRHLLELRPERRDKLGR